MSGSLLIALWCITNPAPVLKPHLEYRLRIDPADLSGIAVELQIRGAPPRLVLAAAAHPEYDDKYWRFIEDFRAVDGEGNPVALTRSDSVLWPLENRAGDLLVRYRVRFPTEPAPRAAWRPFLTRTGGLVGGPHSFLYPVGLERTGARIHLDVPPGWSIATPLDSSEAGTLTAPDLHTLMESPIQVGIQSAWRFEVSGVPHRVFYWRLPEAQPFDTVAFVAALRRVTEASVSLFGGTPYRHYTFLFQDGAYGGLEHPVSATLGVPSSALASDPHALLLESTHEFFHTWNLMRIKPVEYLGLTYRTQPPVAGLWFSEGLTLFYADLLLRRAGLPPPHPTRIAHLERLMERYWSSPGHARFSAETISRVAYNAGPGALGDYSASAHLVGELIGAMLDLRIREATRGERSIDDVMRVMNRRYAERGFTSAEVRRAVEEICECNVAELFERSVFSAAPIDFNRYLAAIGFRAGLAWEPARERDGRPMRDLRLYGYNRLGEDTLRLIITDPGNAWGRAGLHTHDVLLSMNGREVKNWPELRNTLSALVMGDTVAMRVRQAGVERVVQVPVAGYDRPAVRIEPLPDATAEQRRLFEAWRHGR